MYRIIILYEEAPDAEGYTDHVDRFCQAPNGVFRHGEVTGAAMGEPAHAYYAEFEFADKQAFDEFVRSEQFMGAGRDVMERGWKLSGVEFAELA
ncbi:MAG TPA: hypothetical protein VKB43_04660 [Gaiellaceae bacterium]|nr:hypothetical protein [Gaiellaceae bacterium]